MHSCVLGVVALGLLLPCPVAAAVPGHALQLMVRAVT
jgi:hypothetical protein